MVRSRINFYITSSVHQNKHIYLVTLLGDCTMSRVSYSIRSVYLSVHVSVCLCKHVLHWQHAWQDNKILQVPGGLVETQIRAFQSEYPTPEYPTTNLIYESSLEKLQIWTVQSSRRFLQSWGVDWNRAHVISRNDLVEHIVVERSNLDSKASIYSL